MHRWVAGGNPHGIRDALGWNRAHRYHLRSREHASRHGGGAGAIHRHVAPLFNVFQLDSVFYQRSFKGKRAANQKGHHVLAPVPGRIRYRVHELAVFEDAVARNIGANIALGQKR